MLKCKRFYCSFFFGMFFFITSFVMISCSKEDSPAPVPTGESKQYSILNTNLSDFSGTVDFIENTNGSTTISLQVLNTIKNIDNVVRLRSNTANLGGGIAVSLNSLNGDKGISNTTVEKLQSGEVVNYAQLAEFNGYLAIEGINENAGVLLAYVDLGPNELTGKKSIYDLLSPDGVFSGLVTVQERKKGTASLTVGIREIDEDVELPCSLHIPQYSNGEEFIQQLFSVKSDLNGFSFNELNEIDGNEITYDELLELNAFIEVSNQDDSSSFIAKAGIGAKTN
ncbi:hypothetical protein ZONE111904_04150 [Zobellia nedashkovskayae]